MPTCLPWDSFILRISYGEFSNRISGIESKRLRWEDLHYMRFCRRGLRINGIVLFNYETQETADCDIDTVLSVTCEQSKHQKLLKF